jgi:F420-dependent oxidoreductase-like protein
MIKIGTLLELETSVHDAVAQAKGAKQAGLSSVWATQIFGHDALTVLAVIASQVEGLELGTAVVPVFTRHPQVMAQQALTVQSASGDRLSLGIGLSHRVVVESMWGHSYDRPARYMREYLEALIPLLHGEAAALRGELLTAVTPGPLRISDVSPPSLLVAALAPAMLKLAGSLADGTVTWMTGIGAIASHIAPRIREAAAAAERPPPRIVVSLPVSLTDDAASAREAIDRAFSIYPKLPSYKAMMEIEGVERPSQIGLIGSEAQILEGIERIEEAGGTELVAAPSGNGAERQATVELLGALARR